MDAKLYTVFAPSRLTFSDGGSRKEPRDDASGVASPESCVAGPTQQSSVPGLPPATQVCRMPQIVARASAAPNGEQTRSSVPRRCHCCRAP